MSELFLPIISFVVVLSPLVIIHELGHYWIARWCGVRIESFSIGFGPTLFGWKDRHQTHWKVSLFLLGGYVRMAGENDPASRVLEGGDSSQKVAYKETMASKSPLQKMAIAAAGPLANYLLAALLFLGLFAIVGETVYLPVAGALSPSSIAAKSGMKKGDRLLMIQNVPVKKFEDILEVLDANQLKNPLSILVDRQGETLMLSLDAHDPAAEGCWRGHVGLTPHPAHSMQKEVSFKEAVIKTGVVIKELSVAPLRMMKAKQFEGISGPLGIAQRTAMAWQQGPEAVLLCMAMISVGLGLLNLFPIPVLDGGVILLAFLEAVRGKALSERMQNLFSYVSVAFLLSLFVFFSWKDLLKILDQ